MGFITCKICNATITGDAATNQQLIDAHNLAAHPEVAGVIKVNAARRDAKKKFLLEKMYANKDIR